MEEVKHGDGVHECAKDFEALQSMNVKPLLNISRIYKRLGKKSLKSLNVCSVFVFYDVFHEFRYYKMLHLLY